jgi:hypothetical protein
MPAANSAVVEVHKNLEQLLMFTVATKNMQQKYVETN